MIPLAVVNQGSPTSTIIIDYSTNGEPVTLEGAIYLDEEFKKVMNRYPKDNESVVFTIPSTLTVLPADFDEHGLNSGTHWNQTNNILVNNYANIYGRGGDGGVGALVVKYASNKAVRIPASNGQDGYSAVNNTTAAGITIYNHGKLISGGGGGGGGAAWEHILTDYRYGGYTWWTRRDGTAAGGGAPNGRKSYPVGSPEWYIKLASSSEDVQVNLYEYNRVSNSKPKPRLGMAIRNNGKTRLAWHPSGVIYKGKPNDVNVDTTTPVTLNISNPLSPLNEFILPQDMPVQSYPDYEYTLLISSKYKGYPLAKRYGEKKLIRQHLIDSSIVLSIGVGPGVLTATDSEGLTPGWGGCYSGLSDYLSPIHNWDGFSPSRYQGTPANTPYVKPLVWDDNFGGDGGFAGQRGDDGYYDGVYISARNKGGTNEHRVIRLSKDYIDSHKDVMYYEKPGTGGLAGYVTTGNVNVVNMGSGVAIGRT